MNNLTPKEKRLLTRQRRKKAKAKGMRIGTRGFREAPADGIERFERDGHKFERCVTPDAMQARREEVYARSGGHCEGCKKVAIYLDYFHMHHIHGKGRGRKCECLDCLQALCPDAALSDSTIRPGCHTLAHHAIDINGKFDPEKSTRLGEKFERPTVSYKSEFVI